MIKELSKEARLVLEGYLILPLPGESVTCPYYNNARNHVRMGLRAQIGKGSPEEIADEALLYAIREKLDLEILKPSMRKQFLLDHNLGIDCSGLVYHILAAETQARGLGGISQLLKFPYASGFWARLGRFMRKRYAENTDVKTLSHENNSRPVSKIEIQPGDILVSLKNNSLQQDHVVVVTKVDGEKIWVAQSELRPKDTSLSLGVREEILTSLDALSPRRMNWL